MGMELESWPPNSEQLIMMFYCLPWHQTFEKKKEARRVDQHRSFHWSRMALLVRNAEVLMKEPGKEADPFRARAGSFLKGVGSFCCE